MDKRMIDKLHEHLIDNLTSFYNDLNFTREFKNSSFVRDGISIELYVNTKIGDYFTIRPGISVSFKDVIEEINRVDEIRPLKINGHFFLDHKLANTVGVKDYDKCKENSMGSNQAYFLHKITNYIDVEKVVRKHIEIIHSFGYSVIEKCSLEQSFYKFLESVASGFIHNFKKYPSLPIVERPLRLTRESYLTLIWFACKEDISRAENLFENFESIFGAESSMIKDMKLIITDYQSLYPA